VIDDVLPPWRPQGIEIRGTADAITDPEPRIRIHPQRIVSWGFEGASGAHRVPATTPTENVPPAGRPPTGPETYAVLRSSRYDPDALADAEADLEEFQRVHAAQPGYGGTIVIDAGDGTASPSRSGSPSNTRQRPAPHSAPSYTNFSTH
jgi:hypothetical protein